MRSALAPAHGVKNEVYTYMCNALRDGKSVSDHMI